MKRFSSALLASVSKPPGDCTLLRSPRSKRGLSPSLSADFNLLFVAAFTLASVQVSWADVFGSGTSSLEIEFVTIGNPPDTTDRPVTDSAVAYSYRIGTYEISEQMIAEANALGGLGITIDKRS